MTADAVHLLYCTCPDTQIAERIAEALVETRLAACVNIVPGLHSIYRWKGKVENDAECLLLIKTRAARIAEVTACVRRLHPYELPEIIAVPVVAGHAPYLDWVRESTGPEQN